jgi:hypothetical protein
VRTVTPAGSTACSRPAGGIFLPLIIGYQIWNYYVFRERIRPDEGGLDRGY